MATELTGYPANDPFRAGDTFLSSGNVGTLGQTFPGSEYKENVLRTYDFTDVLKELFVDKYKFLGFIKNLGMKGVSEIKVNGFRRKDQWHRRRGKVGTAIGSFNIAPATANNDRIQNVDFKTNVDKYGIETDEYDQEPLWLIKGQVIDMGVQLTGRTAAARGGATTNTKQMQALITSVTRSGNNLRCELRIQSIDGYEYTTANFPTNVYSVAAAKNSNYMVAGSAHPEGSTNVPGWIDEIGTLTNWLQIFRNGTPEMSGTMQAMEYRVERNRFARGVYDMLLSHEQDKAFATMFGQGRYTETFNNQTGDTEIRRQTWGFIPYIKLHGHFQQFEYGTATFDHFSDFMSDFTDPYNGGIPQHYKLHCSRKVMRWIRSCTDRSGKGGFTTNTMTDMGGIGRINHEAGMKFDPMSGTPIYVLKTDWGILECHVEEIFRGDYEDYAIMPHYPDLQYCYMEGNGHKRHDYYMESVEDNGKDSRIDQIISECGVEFSHPERHAVINFTGTWP